MAIVSAMAPVAPAHAVILYSTGSTTANTTAPTGTYANSGWQWIGPWAGSFLGTAIAPQYFVSAIHVGGAVGSTFTLNGNSYTTIPFADGSPSKPIAGTDLIVWRVSGTFSSYAPLWNESVDGSELGKATVIVGRGTQRGAEMRMPQSTGELRGWQWGAADGVQRWGTNVVTLVQPMSDGTLTQPAIVMTFDAKPSDRPPGAVSDPSQYSGPYEAMLSAYDSGGAVFIKSGTGPWKLAGINWAVAAGFTYSPNSSGTSAALFDYGGFYPFNSSTPVEDTYVDKPGYSVASRISPNVAAVASAINGPPVWVADASGTWSDNSKWWTNYYGTGTNPNAAGAEAVFGSNTTAPRTITVDSAKTLGTLSLGGTHGYTFAGPAGGTIALNTTAPAGAAVKVYAGNHTIGVPVSLAVNTTVTTDASPAGPSSTLTMTSALTASAGVTLTKAGPGTLVVRNLRVPAVSVNAGLLKVSPDGGTSGAGLVTAVTVASTGVLDVSDNDLIINYPGTTVRDTIRQYLLDGRNGGTWNGVRLVSSAAAGDAQQRTAIGFAEASELGVTSFSGQSFDTTSLILKYTWYGDTNLDGTVAADDYVRLDRGLAMGLTGWFNGDFNYDNVIDGGDYALIDRVFLTQSGGTLSPAFLAERDAQFGPAYIEALISAVPEPGTSLALTGFAACGLLRRGPRRQDRAADVR